MAVPDARDGGEEDPTTEIVVSALRSSPDRTVFTEDGNPDGWIATNYTVEPTR